MIVHQKKRIIEFSLCQIIFLVGAFTCLSAGASPRYVPDCSKRILARSERASSGTVQNSHAPVIKPEASGSEKETTEPEVLVAEYEEDDLVSFKKHSENGHYFNILSKAVASGYCFHLIKEGLPSCEASYPLPPHKSYLLFHVFRL